METRPGRAALRAGRTRPPSRRWSPLRGATALVTLGLVLTACAILPLPPPPDREPPGPGSTAGPEQAVVPDCASLAVRSCALPYPSDEFAVPDPGTATGRRLRVPDSLVPERLLSQFGPGAGLEDAFGDRDGFSSLSPVIFEVDQPIDPRGVPEDGGSVVEVLDVATGLPVPIRVELPFDAAMRGAPNTIVMAWPRLRWEYGHTYLARLARVPGQLGPPLPAQGMGWSSPWVEALRASVERLDDRPWDELLSVTSFTVGSRGDAIGELELMAKIAAAEDHPIRSVSAWAPFLIDGAASVVTGQVAVSDFRDADGVVAADQPPRRHWVPFALVVPEVAASPAGAPVAIYGHGLVINKESMVVVASHNARRGVATLGIDVPNHGYRSGEGGFLLDLANPRRLGRLVNMPLQGIVDHVSLVSALTEHMAGLDASPWHPDGTWGDGAPDLDTSRILYEGTSMGGVLGVGEVALIPEIDAAFLQVPGAGISDIIMHSLLWIVFQGVLPTGASAGDAAALMGAATMLLDRTDTAHLLDGLRDSGRPVFVQLGVGDAIVPTFTSERLVTLLGLPRVGRGFSDIPAAKAGDRIPPDGRGFSEVWSMQSNPGTQGFMAHVSFIEARAEELLDEWLLLQLGSG